MTSFFLTSVLAFEQVHLSRKTCHIFHLHYQEKLANEKHFKDNLQISVWRLRKLAGVNEALTGYFPRVQIPIGTVHMMLNQSRSFSVALTEIPNFS